MVQPDSGLVDKERLPDLLQRKQPEAAAREA